MRILIIENEIYLAQNISNKLNDLGYFCNITTSTKGVSRGDDYDIIILSMGIKDENILNFIQKNKDVIIILLISYITNDTVSKPIKAGAIDYIQKPFMIEELIRKINHFKEYRKLKFLARTYEEFLNSYFDFDEEFSGYKNLKFPLALKVSQIKQADGFILNLTKKLNKNFVVINCTIKDYFDKILKTPPTAIGYIQNYQILKSSEKEKVKNIISNKNFIISTTDFCDEFDFCCIDMPKNESVFEENTILTIDDYIKFIIKNYQKNFSDTELSKRLGISRKSLWEKRKRYEIARKK